MKRSFLPTYKILLCGLLLAGMLLVGIRFVGATADAPLWGDLADAPTVKLVDGNYIPSQEAEYNCHDQDFVLRVSSDGKHPFNPVFEDQTYTQCAFYTTFGLVGTSGVMQLNHSIQAYHISANSINGTILPVPNAKSLFVLQGTVLAAYDDPLSDFKVGPGYDDLTTTYKNLYWLKDNVSGRYLNDSAGHMVNGISHIKSSPNAQWFVAQKGQQFLRIKADTFELSTFPGDYDTWGDPLNDDMAISNNGRYVAVTGNDRLSLKLYDLSTCQFSASANHSPDSTTGCSPIDMYDFLKSQISGQLIRVGLPRFNADTTQLSLKAVIGTGAGAQTELISLLAPGAQYNDTGQRPTNYIALGDSYASGEGAFNYFTGTDEGDNKCHLSKASYPYLLGLKLQLDSVHSVACSGARMVNVNGSGTEAPQHTTKPLDAFSDDWLPGYDPQLRFIDEKQPNIVTVSMVGNDVGFADIIKRCILFNDTCYSSYEDRMGLVENINSRFNSMVAMYSQIKAAAAPGAKVYVIGYPSIVKPDGNCRLNVYLNGEETEFASKLTNYLDYVIKLAAQKAGVTYVDTEDALDGYRLCDDHAAASAAVNGLTAGNDTLHMIGQESYHPTAFGHQLLANTIAALTDDMTEGTPAPNWAIKGPDASQAADFLDSPKTGQGVRKIELDDASSWLLLPPNPINGVLQAYKYHLDSKTSYDFILHSTSIKLGTAQSDQDGNLSYSFSIPQGIEPGWHTLDVIGNDITGQPVDIQRMIYVATTADDWDGDGIPNSQETCGLIPASGVDVDKDGIDDACDGVISKLPIPAAPTVSITDPINAANVQHVTVSGSGDPGTTAHISVDDTNPDTKAVTATATLASSDANTADYTKLLDVSSLDDGKLTVSVMLSNGYGTSPAATADTTKDTQPPTVILTTDPAANSGGWNNQAVKVQLSASDAGTGVAEITYGATGAQPVAAQAVGVDQAAFTVNNEGKTVITYTATDQAGNSTITQTKEISIDTEPPITSINQPQLPVLFGVFGNVLTGTTTDNLSGAATTQITFVSQGHKKITTTLQATCISSCDTTKTTWQVNTFHLPSGQYTVTASSTDQASNVGPATSPLRIVIVNFPWLWW